MTNGEDMSGQVVSLLEWDGRDGVGRGRLVLKAGVIYRHVRATALEVEVEPGARVEDSIFNDCRIAGPPVDEWAVRTGFVAVEFVVRRRHARRGARR